MAFSYDAGSSSPTLAGLVEFNSLRINDGSFKTHRVPPITDSAPIRDSTFPLPSDHGGYLATQQFYDPWLFDIEGWVLTTSPDDIPGALDYLRGKFNLDAGLQTLTVNARGWSAARQMTARIAGQIVVNEPDLTQKKVARRDFVIPLVAADPRLYATTLQSVTVDASESLTNDGTTATPFAVRFNGPQTNPKIDGPGSAGSNRIRYEGVIASGDWVEVSTDASNGVSAVDNTGANVYGGLTAFTARTIAAGASTWSATNDSGAGTTVVKFRSAWL